MSNSWPLVPLGEVLTKSEEWIDLNPEEWYREITVRLWGKGVVLRREASGAEISAPRRLRVRAGRFILSRIDARNGAFGLVPDSLEGAVVSNDFPVFTPNPLRLVPSFLNWMSKTRDFIDLCETASEGTTNRVRLQENRFLAMKIPLPSVPEQRRIAARIEELAAKIEEACSLRKLINDEIKKMLWAQFSRLVASAESKPMSEAAPIVRRPVEVGNNGFYPELGIRSFGKGTFHKPALSAVEVGTKRLFCIEPGDLIFNNVFAWEGAVAVAKPKDSNRFGSHRFITCVAKKGIARARFLCFYFLTSEGLEKLGEASPGGAGRNRTLGLEALSEIKVPLPAYEKQMWFEDLQAKVEALNHAQVESGAELDALLPSILDRAFRGKL